MADSDWDTVTVLRKHTKPSDAKSTQAVNRAMLTGAAIDTSKKFGAGGNRQHETAKNTARLDEETEELKHDKVSLSVGKAIMQGRNAKGLTQKDLATRINEKPNVINEYESGRAIPNPQILGKIERIIGLKLRGKDIGSPFPQPGGK